MSMMWAMARFSLFISICIFVSPICKLGATQTVQKQESPKAEEAKEKVEPFRIAIDDSQLADLKQRIETTRWPDKEPVSDWSQGVPLQYLQELAKYWSDSYKWRERERQLNRFAQFKMMVKGVEIHFIHMRSPHKDAEPLVLTHGWPGSFVEFLKVIDPLINPTAHGGKESDAFHVIVPSLPGYGFSGKPTEVGWGVERIADAWDALMQGLGYDSYFAQGGDWGSAITTTLAQRHPERCKGIHVNMVVLDRESTEMNDLSEHEKRSLRLAQHFSRNETGYSELQRTKPQTLGYGLADSPIAQAAWILEKFHAWSDNDGHLEKLFSPDALLDNVMLYWLTNSGTSSARLYWESYGKLDRNTKIGAPACVSVFPKEIFVPSLRWVKSRFINLVYFNKLDKGGHFAAMEQPEVFVKELRACKRAISNH